MQKTLTALLWIVLGLAVIALVAESLSEVKAKLIVVPTLVLVIGLSAVELKTEVKEKMKCYYEDLP
jgi:hypothetical protein